MEKQSKSYPIEEDTSLFSKNQDQDGTNNTSDETRTNSYQSSPFSDLFTFNNTKLLEVQSMAAQVKLDLYYDAENLMENS